jgi:hypothetical protein
VVSKIAYRSSSIDDVVERLHTRAFRKIDGNRRSRFKALELAALKALPAVPYEFGEWRKAKVQPAYRIEVARAYCSVPYRWIDERLDMRLTACAVEIFHSSELVTAHPRAKERAQRSTRRAIATTICETLEAGYVNDLMRQHRRALAFACLVFTVVHLPVRRRHPRCPSKGE